MKILTRFLALLAGMFAAPVAHAEIAPGELVAPKIEISGGNLNFTVQPSVAGRNYQLQYSDTMATGNWTDIGVGCAGDGSNLVISTPCAPGVARRFYRLALTEVTSVPDGFVLIPAGGFSMGNTLSVSGDGYSNELPVHSVQVSAFYMAKYLVTKADWDVVRTWGLTHGYTDLAAGEGKAVYHPVQMLIWYEMVKWCNAWSEKNGLTPCYTLDGTVCRTTINDAVVCNWSANGYRLPTEAEWEKAARGGLSGKRFPWGDTINHTYANFYSWSQFYESPKSQGFHPTYAVNGFPYTSPVGSFAANGYGLYDMTGNVWEWCWDWYGGYTASMQTDPRGASSGSMRVYRGGSWGYDASGCRVANRGGGPSHRVYDFGFRVARSSIP